MNAESVELTSSPVINSDLGLHSSMSLPVGGGRGVAIPKKKTPFQVTSSTLSSSSNSDDDQAHCSTFNPAEAQGARGGAEEGFVAHLCQCCTSHTVKTLYFLLLQKEEEAAAKLYEDFVESFGGGDDKPAANQSTSSFMPGGTIMPGQAAPLRGTNTQSSFTLISASASPW